MLLPLTPLVYRKRKNPPRPRRKAAPTPPQDLVLVAAAYSKDEYTLTLTFDRAVALVDFDGAMITLNDDIQLSLSFDGTGGATIAGPETVVVGLVEVGPPTGAGITFSASGATGIVAVDDGGTWAGAVDQALPFP